jgi:hypothetical protein
MRDLQGVAARLQVDAAMHAPSVAMPAGSVQRFRERMVREGMVEGSARRRVSSLYALAAVAAVVVLVAAMVSMPRGRREVEGVVASEGTPVVARQVVAAGVERAAVRARRKREVRAREARYGLASRRDVEVTETSVAAPRFSQAIAGRYAFLSPRSVGEASVAGYPALNRSEISRVDFLANVSDERDALAIERAARPVDIASAGKTFDFAADIRQLHFQLPTSQ